MKLLKCPKCGEMFSDTYKTCPFCAEDEDLHSDKRHKSGGRRVGGGKKSPSALGPVLVACLVLVVGLLGYTVFGDQIASLIGGKADDTPTPQPVAATLTLDKAELALTTGQSAKLTASGGEKITFTSGNEAVATVSEDGSIQAVAPGSTVVVASSGEQKATCRVTVTDVQTGDNTQTTQPAEPKNLTLRSIFQSEGTTLQEFSIAVGQEVRMVVDGTDSVVSWQIDDTSVATVSADGVVTGVSNDQSKVAVLTAVVDGQTLSCNVRGGGSGN